MIVNKEIKSLTGLRGVASLYVCLYHFNQYFSENNKDSILVKNKYFSVFVSHGYIAVDLFFMLSAFVLTLSSAWLFDDKLRLSNYKFFMQRRFIRVYPSYFLIVIVAFIFIYHYNHVLLFFCSLTLLNTLVGAPYMLANHWSLGVEWITYFLFPAFYKLSRLFKYNWWTYILACCGLLILYITGIVYSDYKNQDYLLKIATGYYSIARCFGCYLLGIASFKAFKFFKIEFIYKSQFSIAIVMLIFCGLSFADTDIIIVFLFMLLLISVSKDNNVVSRILSSKIIYFLGIISYPLYLIHFFISLNLSIVYSCLRTLNLGINLNVSLFVFYFVVCILLSSIFTYCLELPIIKYLNVLNKRQDKKFKQKTMILNESKLKN